MELSRRFLNISMMLVSLYCVKIGLEANGLIGFIVTITAAWSFGKTVGDVYDKD